MNHSSKTSLKNLVIKKPLNLFLSIVLSLSWFGLTWLHFNSLPTEIGLIILTYIGLLGISVFITYLENGKVGIKNLLSGIVRWRVSLGYYFIALLAIPLLTSFIAFFTGNVQLTEVRFITSLTNYFVSLVSLFLLINLWEETGWTGFFQNRLMKQKGLFLGSILTAPAFAAIHLPLLLKDPTMNEMIINFTVLLGLSFFFRYLVGMLYIDTKGSLLIIGLLHASFNSANDLEFVTGEYELIIATIIITITVATVRNLRSKSVSR